jgi:hypothetical protein
MISIGFAVLLGATGVALAQGGEGDPGASQYEAPLPQGEQAADAGGEGEGLESKIGGLPFTGIDLIVLAGTALVLTGTGFALHRLSAPRF